MKRKIAVAVVVAAVAAGGVTGWAVTGRDNSNGVVSTPVAISANQFVSGAWARIPDAPIKSRSMPVGLWTGSQMFVWGGAPDGGNKVAGINEGWPNDGATYDPAARTWTRLPESPLSGRYQSAAVMAGDKVFIWGGLGRASSDTDKFDGATYDPARRVWETLPAGPTEPYDWAKALWDGNRVLLLTAVTDSGQVRPTDPAVVHAYSYDPAARTWQTLPALTMHHNQKIGRVSAVLAGGRLWVWPHWYHETTKRTRETVEISETHGVPTYTYDIDAKSWEPRTIAGADERLMVDPIWTGSQILVPFTNSWCFMCLGGGLHRATYGGLRIDPTAVTAAPLLEGPTSGLGAEYLWASGNLLAFNTTSSGGGLPGTGMHHPGEAAVWDPATNAWQSLPRAPLTGAGDTAVWTGSRLLVWGFVNGGGGDARGIEFVPAPVSATTEALGTPDAINKMTMSPTSGPVGTVVHLSGQRCTDEGSALTNLSFDGATTRTDLPSVRGPNYTFDLTWTVPDRLTPASGSGSVPTVPGTYQFSSHPAYCQAAFTVTPGHAATKAVTVRGEITSKTVTGSGLRIVIAPDELKDGAVVRLPVPSVTYDIPKELMIDPKLVIGDVLVTTENGVVTGFAIAGG